MNQTFIRILGVCCVLLSGHNAGVCADSPSQSLINDLGSNEFKTRSIAKRELLKLYQQQPSILNDLCRVAFDKNADIEKVLNATEILNGIVKDHLFVERGAIGIALQHDLKVSKLELSAPAQEAGVKLQWELLKAGGKDVKGMSPADVYVIVHKTKPGDKLALVFKDELGKEVTVHPVVAPRSKIRSDENVEERKKEFYKEWMESKRNEIQNAE